MLENKEVELKTILTEEQFNALLQFYLPANFIEQTNHYFSAANKTNYQSIRIREKEGKFLFTLKEKYNDYVQEYEKYTQSLNLYDDADIIKVLEDRNLYPPYNEMGKLTTKRFTYIIPEQAELCFDINEYYGITDYEVEYEVIQSHNHVEAFINILKQANIEFIPNPISKVKRCLQAKEKND